MRRRTFIQTLPLAAAASAAALQNSATVLGQSGSDNTPDPASGETSGLAKFQPAGAEQFIRPDVHAGDRPSGASFATRSPALGLNGAAGTAHPLATQTAIAMLKRGGSAVDAAVAANAVLGFVEPTSSGLGGDCFAFVWDPKCGEADGHGKLGTVAEIAFAGHGAFARRARPHSGGGGGERFHSGRARRMVGIAPALRKAEVGRAV